MDRGTGQAKSSSPLVCYRRIEYQKYLIPVLLHKQGKPQVSAPQSDEPGSTTARLAPGHRLWVTLAVASSRRARRLRSWRLLQPINRDRRTLSSRRGSVDSPCSSHRGQWTGHNQVRSVTTPHYLVSDGGSDDAIPTTVVGRGSFF